MPKSEQIDPTTGVLTAANRYTYSSWGTPTTTTLNSYADLGFRYLYVGRFDVQWDSSSAIPAGLLYMHARHYSPEFGRFLQPDPAAAETNLYAYAENNPVTKVDPSGLVSWECTKMIWEAIFLKDELRVIYREIQENKLDLPWLGKFSVEGHRTKYEDTRNGLRNKLKTISEKCRGQGPRPPGFGKCAEQSRISAPYPTRPGRWSQERSGQASKGWSGGLGIKIDPYLVATTGGVAAAGVMLWAAIRFGSSGRPMMTL